MIVHQAEWLLPIVTAPIRRGWVAVEAGRIAALGGPADPPPAFPLSGAGSSRPADGADGAEAILPGVVNAHVHLELSWMRGRVPPSRHMPAWASSLVALRRTAAVDAVEPIVDAVREARAAGTSLVGDVGNSYASYEPLAGSSLSAVIFRELLGFGAVDPARMVAGAIAAAARLPPREGITISIAPHAPYSVSPGLLRAIAGAAGGRPVSVHLAESREELEFLRDGTGPWRALLERLGAWSPAWMPPGCGPVEYLNRFGLVNDRLVAVHGVQLTESELAGLARAGATLVTCPRSNRWTGAGVPPVERFYASGVRVATGTDSLASVDDLNIFSELAELRRLAPGVAARRLLRSATLDGAEALGFAGELGSVETGKRADLIAVSVPPGVSDVEEYLVGGVPPAAIRWLDAGMSSVAGRREPGDDL